MIPTESDIDGSKSSNDPTPPRLVGVLGGSFDPPHVGHVALAEYALTALERTSVEIHHKPLAPEEVRVWVLPAGRHPFGKATTSAERRLEMCRLAFAEGGDRRIEVRDDEIRWSRENPDAPTYTVETLERLAKNNPGVELRLILGGDLADEVEKWRAWRRIQEIAPPLWVPREGYSASETEREAKSDGFRSLPDVSSSEIRRKIANGEPLAGIIPAKVAEYIGEHELYASSG